MSKTTKFLISLLVFLILFVPVLSFAQSSTGLVPCTNAPVMNGSIVATNPDGSVQYTSKCDFNALMNMINTIINFILYYLTIPIAAIMFAYVGFLYLTSGSEPAKRTKASGIAWDVVVGLVIAVAAWLIIKTLLGILSPAGTWSWIGF